jgi:uncharacterized protein
MTLSSPLRPVVLALAACLLFLSSTAWAKFVPPPLKEGHVVTMVGWLAPYDIRKINEEADIAQNQTGYVIDVLLAPSDEPIEEISAETFQAWKPGDPKKDNGLLLVIQPNFPRGQRKARLQVGKGVEAALPASRANEILRGVIGPLINSGDEVRTAVASGVLALAKVLGADESMGPAADAGGDAAASPAGALPETSPPPPGAPQAAGEAPAATLAKVLGGFLLLVAAYVAVMWLRSRARRTH